MGKRGPKPTLTHWRQRRAANRRAVAKYNRSPKGLANAIKRAERIEAIKSFVEDVKSSPCVDCERTFHPVAMDFDHVRGVKKYAIGNLRSWNVSLETVKEEIAKCDLVCSNCHRVRTFGTSYLWANSPQSGK